MPISTREKLEIADKLSADELEMWEERGIQKSEEDREFIVTAWRIVVLSGPYKSLRGHLKERSAFAPFRVEEAEELERRTFDSK